MCKSQNLDLFLRIYFNLKQEKAVEMWNVRPIYAKMRYLNLQKELLAGEAPHLEITEHVDKTMEEK